MISVTGDIHEFNGSYGKVSDGDKVYCILLAHYERSLSDMESHGLVLKRGDSSAYVRVARVSFVEKDGMHFPEVGVQEVILA